MLAAVGGVVSASHCPRFNPVRDASMLMLLQVSRLLGAFQNPKQVTRGLAGGVSIIMSFIFSF